ncbi:tol-pal system YbgF family protein [Streptomyces sp. NPDC059979]|uniref:tol-pal system YbgF family protein n=1 Tax=unclassified Streptomyces TaxID=2593676 RepID=UPI00365082B9
MARREPNGRLRTLLADARWSGQDFARAVNGVAAETGLTLRYDRTSISHWLAGTRPPAHVVALAAEALSRRTGRRVSPADTGLARPAGAARARDRPGPGPHGADALAPEPAGVGTPGAGDAAAYAESLLGEIPVYSSAWRPPGWPPPHGTGTPTGAPTGAPARPAGRIGADHVEAAEAVLPVFRNADMMFGSGLARPALTRYLATTVAPWLRADAAPAVRHRLLGCAARLAYTAGFLCFDGNQQGTAQAYYRAGLRLGREAGDPQCWAPVLRAMSVQAHHLGHRKQAWELAEAAAREVGRLPSLQAAFVTGQLAVAEAGCGDRRAALIHLGEAERLLERSAGRHAAIGDYHPAALAHQQAEALAALGDARGAITALGTSLRHRPADERRARAVTLARLAELHLGQGHVERACATWHEMLDVVPQLDSARVDDAVRRLRGRLQPVRGNRTARALLERVRGLG